MRETDRTDRKPTVYYKISTAFQILKFKSLKVFN